MDNQRGVSIHARAAFVSAGGHQFDRSAVADAEFAECGCGWAWIYEPGHGGGSGGECGADGDELRSRSDCAKRVGATGRMPGAACGVEWAVCEYAGVFQLFPAV